MATSCPASANYSTLTAKTAGTAGNSVTLAESGGAVISGSTFTGGVAAIPLSGPRVTVRPQTSSFGGIVMSTAAEVIAAVNASSAVSAVVSAAAAGPVTGYVAAFTATNLSGGAGSVASLTLTTATPGASIRYTTDGSYPTPTNGTLYTAPFPPPAVGTTVRAAAYKTGLNPGDCLEFNITA